MADFEKVLLDPSLKTAQELQMTWQELFEHRSSMQRATSARRHVAAAAALKLPNSCDVEPGPQLQSAALVATAEEKSDYDDDMTGAGFNIVDDTTVRSDATADHQGDDADGTNDCHFRGAESCDSGAHITVKTETTEGDDYCLSNDEEETVYCDEIDDVDMLNLDGNDPADGYFYRGVLIFNYP